MAALPKSPAGNRRSSSGSGLRPVLPLGLDDGSAIDDLDDLDEPELGPAPRGQSTPFTEGVSVDEVEYAYGYVRERPNPLNFLIAITGSEDGENTQFNSYCTIHRSIHPILTPSTINFECGWGTPSRHCLSDHCDNGVAGSVGLRHEASAQKDTLFGSNTLCFPLFFTFTKIPPWPILTLPTDTRC